MEFHISLAGGAPDLARFRAAVSRMDPSALVDRDPLGQHLRVATNLSADQLQDAARDSDWDVAESRIDQQASDCCGGCGG